MCLQQDSTTYIYLIYIRQKLSIKYFMLTLYITYCQTEVNSVRAQCVCACMDSFHAPAAGRRLNELCPWCAVSVMICLGFLTQGVI